MSDDDLVVPVLMLNRPSLSPHDHPIITSSSLTTTELSPHYHALSLTIKHATRRGAHEPDPRGQRRDLRRGRHARPRVAGDRHAGGDPALADGAAALGAVDLLALGDRLELGAHLHAVLELAHL